MFDTTRRKVIKALGMTVVYPISLPLATGVNATSLSPAIDSNGWVSGGTEMITESFPGNEIFELDTACSIEMTEPRILGPCFFSVDSSSDISTGLTGLPMMLCLQLIDRDCNPLMGHEVEVWHTDHRGVYSANTAGSDESNRFRTRQCAGTDYEALNSTWFRGSQISDKHGRVNFKTCFPGWYGGRTIHVHVRVKNRDRVSLTSQFYFDEVLSSEICTSHSDYVKRGLQDTPLYKDRFFRSNTESSIFSTRKNPDGSLLAFKTLQI